MRRRRTTDRRLDRAETAEQELHALQAITDTALSHLSLDDLLTALLERITDILQVDNAAVLLVDPAGETLTVQAVRGLLEPLAPKVRIPVGQGFAGLIAATREPMVVDDIMAFPVFNPSFREQLHSLAGVPLVLGDQVLGVLHIGTVLPHHFTVSDVQLLQQVADRMALAIDRARLYTREQEAREKLGERVAQLEAVMEAVPDALAVYNTDGTIMLHNTAAEAQVARFNPQTPLSETVGQAFQQVGGVYNVDGRPLQPGQWTVSRALRGEILAGNDALTIAAHLTDGETVYYGVSGAPLRDAEGRITGVATTARDITEQKRLVQALHESEARYRGVVESQTELISRYLPDTTLTFVNEANCRAMGLSREQLVGTKFMDLLPDSAREPVRARIRSLLEHPGVSTMEHQVRMADGSLRWQQWVDRTILDDTGQVIELQGVGRDVTERKQMEQALHESEARYRATFDSAAIGVAIVDLAGRPLEVNEYICRMVGYTGDELCTMALPDFTHPDDVADSEGLLRRALDGEIGSYQLEKRYLHKDGHIVWGRVSASLVRGQDGTPMYFVVHLEDITPPKQLEQERAEQAEQLDRIFEGITDGLVVYNAEGDLVRLNAEAHRILGMDSAPANYAQLPVRDRLNLYEARNEQGQPLPHKEWPVVRVLRYQVNGAVTRQVRLRALDGRETELSIGAAPLRDREGRLAGAVVVLHDQTEYKRLAREREGARASELAAQEVAHQLEAFLAMAAHDIRTPVTVVSGQVQVALRRAERLAVALTVGQQAGSVTAESPSQAAGGLVESLGIAQSGVKRLRRLVEHLFDVAQAQTGTLTLKLAPCDLASLVRRNVAAHQATAPERRIVLELPEALVPVEADADRLDQVLSNYLANALKYSPACEPVTVRLETVENLAGVSVTDHGPGLPPEEQSHVWELFHRVPGIEVQSESGEASGSLGLGLSICKRLIELHPGGHVGVESVVGAGSTFWFRLPLAP